MESLEKERKKGRQRLSPSRGCLTKKYFTYFVRQDQEFQATYV